MKKLIVFIVLLGLILPVAGNAALIEERPEMTSCLLKHDLTDLFGPGYEKNELITSSASSELDVSALQKTDILVTSAQVQAQKGLGWGVGWYYKNVAFPAVDGLANVDSTDGFTVAEYESIEAAKHVPGIGKIVGWVADTATLGVKSKVKAREYATFACMIDKIETAEDWFFIIFIITAGVLILYGAFLFLTAAGAPEKLTSARNVMIWAAIGVAIAFISKGIVKIIVQMMA